ncbi:MAG: enoyl-CoA hydratase [Chloroflexi bacterium]|nr:enoyl-CoA hydratase [Chloroflexota bacterium]
MTEEVIFEKEGNIAIMTLNRPEKLNALTTEMRQPMAEAVAKVHADDDIRVLIVTGAGRGFCAGTDVGGQAARLSGEVKEASRRDTLTLSGSAILPLARLEKPTIAAVNGVAAGIGLSLALICDIKIAAEDARFMAAWVKRGLMPDGGASYLIPHLLGMSKALEFMYLGDIIDAREAERIGLVSKVVPTAELMSTTKEMAHRIAQGPPIAIELIKRGAYKALYDRLEAQFEFESYGQNICRTTEDYKEGVTSFLERREAKFKGR